MPMITTRVPALLLAGFLAACSAMPSATSETPPLDGTAWILSALPGRTLADGQAVTLRFEGGRAQGSDGCNRYSAPYTVTGRSLEVSGGSGASTMMACPPETMQQATDYMAALNSAKAWRVDAGQLKLLAADGRALATLAAQPTSLVGSEWRVAAVNNGRQAVVSIISGTTLTMTFAGDGQASGSAGCNRYHARYEAEAAHLRFRSPAATRMMCSHKGIMEQERAFLKALETVTTARHEGDRLELRTADGALAVTLVLVGRE
ncbi:MAG: META domain-containing protein [Dechloromonas sp.]|uniref:META domain-containing protein n=1 Tax=Candidatus Dechloromonas phosphorivorans TaxID=2899244 RepID=A0A9D7LP28_9RHOO|nr:META domain-containing protein [Candidatus Dechloromonas phosphorivorans]